MRVYYNDNEPYAVQWLKNLITMELLPDGEVDDRSIADVTASDLAGFDQCHFFAGIGGWPLALRLAGCAPDWPCWTGSCPCQPFSVAGKRGGTSDKRHLWPEFRRLIAECSPPTVFGEQVASKDGRQWLAGVRTDLETLGYAVGAADLCAAGVGAPHIRQRLFFCAANSDEPGLSARNELIEFGAQEASSSWCEFKRVHAKGAWASREIESDVRVFVDGVPARVGRLRAYGNAIVPQVAAEFIKAFIDSVER